MSNKELPDISRIVEECKNKNSCELEVRYNEPMADHTSFKVGGPADCWLRPSGEGFPAFAVALIAAARTEQIPVFLLGGGANILVADSGIRGLVLDTGGWTGVSGVSGRETALYFHAGTILDDAAEIAAGRGLSGLEFLAGMPGTIGGAIWMNARCYGREIADALAETKAVDFSGSAPQYVSLPVNAAEFGYKHSPFQGRDMLILGGSFQLTQGDAQQIRSAMEKNRRDREDKGHYRFPSAGSVFKNNHSFGKPTGQIIDELGLRGLRIGGAQIAPWHGNIIINTGGAAASDIRSLINEVTASVQSAGNYTLEPEILFIGD